MTSSKKVTSSLYIRTDGPTELSFDELYTWVIWQFPRITAGGMCGAIRPPIAKHGWFPAIIRQQEGRVLVHGHLDEEFLTPNDAYAWFDNPDEA
jgi:hypothetical protein